MPKITITLPRAQWQPTLALMSEVLTTHALFDIWFTEPARTELWNENHIRIHTGDADTKIAQALCEPLRTRFRSVRVTNDYLSLHESDNTWFLDPPETPHKER